MQGNVYLLPHILRDQSCFVILQKDFNLIKCSKRFTGPMEVPMSFVQRP